MSTSSSIDGTDLHRITSEPLRQPALGRMDAGRRSSGPDPRRRWASSPAARPPSATSPRSTWSTWPVAAPPRRSRRLRRDNVRPFRPPDAIEIAFYRAHRRRQVGPVRDESRTGQNVRPIVSPTMDQPIDHGPERSLRRRTRPMEPDLLQPDHATMRASAIRGCCQLWVDECRRQRPAPVRSAGSRVGHPGHSWATAVVSPDGQWVAFWRNLPNVGRPSASPSSASDGTGQVIETGPSCPMAPIWIWSPDSTKLLMFPDGVDTGKAYLLDPIGWSVDGDPMDVGRFPRLAAPGARVNADRGDGSRVLGSGSSPSPCRHGPGL